MMFWSDDGAMNCGFTPSGKVVCTMKGAPVTKHRQLRCRDIYSEMNSTAETLGLESSGSRIRHCSRRKESPAPPKAHKSTGCLIVQLLQKNRSGHK